MPPPPRRRVRFAAAPPSPPRAATRSRRAPQAHLAVPVPGRQAAWSAFVSFVSCHIPASVRDVSYYQSFSLTLDSSGGVPVLLLILATLGCFVCLPLYESDVGGDEGCLGIAIAGAIRGMSLVSFTCMHARRWALQQRPGISYLSQAGTLTVPVWSCYVLVLMSLGPFKVPFCSFSCSSSRLLLLPSGLLLLFIAEGLLNIWGRDYIIRVLAHMLLLKLLSISWSVAGAKLPEFIFLYLLRTEV